MPLDDAAIESFLDLAFAHVCTQPLSAFVDADRLLAAIEQPSTAARLQALHGRIVVPVRERMLARAKASAIKLGAYIPEALVAPIADLIGAPVPLPASMIDELVASEEVRDEVRAMLSDALSSFVKRATGGGSGDKSGEKSGGLRDVLGRGARTFGAVGKGLLGGLGDELQKQMQERVRDFVDGSVAALQERIAKKLKSEETARSFGKARRRGFLKLLEQTESEAASLLESFPFAALDALAPLLVAHNFGIEARREPLREAILSEIRAVLQQEGARPVGDILDELGLRDRARDALRAHGVPLGRTLVASREFAAWLATALPART